MKTAMTTSAPSDFRHSDKVSVYNQSQCIRTVLIHVLSKRMMALTKTN